MMKNRFIRQANWVPYRAIALWPFVFVKHANDSTDPVLLNHERIHHRQQLELGILPFYAAYLGEYAWHRLRGLPHYRAYRAISFEREAYQNEHCPHYLQNRRFGAWWHYRYAHK